LPQTQYDAPPLIQAPNKFRGRFGASRSVRFAAMARQQWGAANGDDDSQKQQRRIKVTTIGNRRWAIAEGYIPGGSNGPEPQMTSHETLCILNSGDRPANITVHIYFTDREPAGPYRLAVEPRRTRHVRFNELEDPEPVPRDTDFASVIEADVPIVVQHTRLDSRQAENALMTTIAYAGG
jgi:hypothetical protein